jgi:hypothetical protein
LVEQVSKVVAFYGAHDGVASFGKAAVNAHEVPVNLLSPPQLHDDTLACTDSLELLSATALYLGLIGVHCLYSWGRPPVEALRSSSMQRPGTSVSSHDASRLPQHASPSFSAFCQRFFDIMWF